MSERDKKHLNKINRADATTSSGLLQIIEDEGYEVTEMMGGSVYIHGDGRDNGTVWTEVIDGKLMLCVGDELGEDARYIPAIIPYCLAKTDVGEPV